MIGYVLIIILSNGGFTPVTEDVTDEITCLRRMDQAYIAHPQNIYDCVEVYRK